MTLNILDPQAFAATDREAWLALVGKALKGADFDRTLVSATDDGIAIQPLYERRVAATPLARRQPSAAWAISQRIDDPDATRALSQLADDLANGATAVSMVFDDSAQGFGTGIGAGEEALVASLFAATAGYPVSVRLEQGGQSVSVVDDLMQSGAYLPQTVHFGIDPFTPAAFGGRPVETADLGTRFRQRQGLARGGTILNADGRIIHNAGGTEAEELAVMAAAIAAYLRLLEAERIEPEAVLGAISLNLCADQDQFLTMAKVRAARLLFARIAEACGVDPAIRPHVFTETSYRMLTLRDPETNILRNTIAVFAAGTGGADEIAVLPHTLAHGIPDPLARRLARNTQLILTAESHLDHVSDPSAGSGGLEALTDALAAKAWALFGDIERAGGLQTAIANGSLASMVAQSRQKRPSGLIVGTTLFAAEKERLVTVLGPRTTVATVGVRLVRRDEETVL
ncbi:MULTISPECIES: methylmalonyl-CoA mutase family protein [Rhizobium]|uniref:Methylmalonyl-CoA mutase family protein n=1 Tax=Rhizobium rhododendri TaxID=2506430 RepID=A0ABY8IIZ8_9HYPH|nr:MULTISPECIES: methylmalonyl-CoA mutase family protein [Rhizobium]MBZ5761605.1 methylmalonyl-CoA mutase family protein [Rhizobium sp. VS19-DR96]MBZ5767124.1 methylmalonyl-CoA mutase family protein [Rhizobium sp. VS19-DR129.2]MBZ5773587.1 methylmalonyl-CoA mutase family protein [Rhizobium sp. VS19-DRK62.2]MBZ5785436.1 methylmalonyl-CoA mutase family protein [Rhizobium sp. VS19-DR121]MBZ5802257.1 methylmalonyl-CoA mutase family protein [Rhizobium sp. VS19-DR181]